MKKFWIILLASFFTVLHCSETFSQVQFGVPKKLSSSILRISGSELLQILALKYTKTTVISKRFAKAQKEEQILF